MEHEVIFGLVVSSFQVVSFSGKETQVFSYVMNYGSQ